MKSLVLSLLFFGTSLASADNRLANARTFLREHSLLSKEALRPQNYEEIATAIAKTPDPESKFGFIVFSIARHKDKLLTNEQGLQLNALIEKRSTSELNWHDIRNIVRIQAVFSLWDFAAATDEQSTAKAKSEWEEWTELRIAYMREEFIDKEKFQRSVWKILTEEQQAKIHTGEWDSYLKKSTGHGRLYSAPKQVMRAFGKPDHSNAFSTAAEKWEALWEPMLDDYLAASKFQRQREFAMNLADESFSISSWNDYATEFRKFATMERDAIRELVQTGYDPSQERDKAVQNIQEKFRNDMIKKYRAKASDFLDLMIGK